MLFLNYYLSVTIYYIYTISFHFLTIRSICILVTQIFLTYSKNLFLLYKEKEKKKKVLKKNAGFLPVASGYRKQH